jgi:ADP-dependent NAD(P)H-hydrate dehydratase
MSTPATAVPLPVLPPRPRDSHKGTFGRVLVVAGSADYSGAAILCGKGALRGGAGLVQVAVPRPSRPIVAAGDPCYITAGLAATEAGALSANCLQDVLTLAEAANVVAIGPGLGQSGDVTLLVTLLLERIAKPVVLDADGLNALALVLATGLPSGRSAPLICTPHPGEFARLDPDGEGSREERAQRFAQKLSCILVLKGHQTLVTDGQAVYHNSTGNPGMATGGAGDVLTGLIAALLGQGLAPFAAAQLGVYLHGLAGDLAAMELGEVSLVATDVVDYLPKAFQLHAARATATG